MIEGGEDNEEATARRPGVDQWSRQVALTVQLPEAADLPAAIPQIGGQGMAPGRTTAGI
jgi:hypothetical protein